MTVTRLERLARRVSEMPGIWHSRRALHERRVRQGTAWQFWGVFHTRDDALKAAHELGHLPVGYDNPGVAQRGRDTYERFHAFDYPALLWIARGLEQGGHHVVDLGGHLGAKFRAYRRIWNFPQDICWTVCETGDVVKASLELPPDEHPAELRFTTDRRCVADADILFASGVLQYLDLPLTVILAGLPSRPRRLVLNKVPLSEGPEVWTVQQAGGVLVPYHVLNRAAFLDGLKALGYRVLDSWTVVEYAARIPFAPGYGTTNNSGLALESTASS